MPSDMDRICQLITERDDAQEAAETYHAAWQDAAVYWKQRLAEADYLLEAASSHAIVLPRSLILAIDRWRGIEGRESAP